MDEGKLRRIASRVANEDKPDLIALLEQATTQGWQLINGILEITGSIYQAVALSKNPEAWEVYKGHRDLADSDSYVLYWWFNDEASAENNEGTFIYSAGDPADYDEGEEVPQKNVEEFEIYSADAVDADLGEMSPEREQEVIARIQSILSGQPPDRWEGAPRSDK